MINLDHISSNPLLPEVKAAMIAAIEADYHNPSSQHSKGDEAAALIDRARASVAGLVNAAMAKEIVFTSGGTESVNHAIKGVALANAKKGNHIITSNIEHNAVIRSLRRLKGQGFTVTSLDVDANGRINPQAVADAITDETIMVSIMHSNNETGVIQPIEDIARITRERKIILHTDAVDSVGVVPIDVQQLGVDVMSFGSNIFYGPTGVGGLYVRRGTMIWPLLDGGVQENNKRAGTENLVGIIGMGVAADLARRDLDQRLAHLEALKAKLLADLPKVIDEYVVNTPPGPSLPNLVSISIKYIEGESVMLMLDDEGIAVSTRSACATGSLRASHVLIAIGLSHADAQGTLVVTFGADNTPEDIDRFLGALQNVVKTLRDLSPLYQKTAAQA
ncbi:MAG: cysteine desulfurase family protein [Desulfobacterales bacterium]|nr:cysteine desulfurase family protein [Desulfobacterales bacterium]MDJ0855951.1 cysteine desulfurase family protein [Desulfobacterales bacterium]